MKPVSWLIFASSWFSHARAVRPMLKIARLTKARAAKPQKVLITACGTVGRFDIVRVNRMECVSVAACTPPHV